MRAVGSMTHGGPEVPEVIDTPELHAVAGQVRLRVHAAAVNPTDTIARNGSRAEQQKGDLSPCVPALYLETMDMLSGPGAWIRNRHDDDLGRIS